MESVFRSELASLDVKNIYVYVADAVRYDYLPQEVAQLGTALKTIAGGIHSPTGFATLVSGLYAPQHGVYGFQDKLSDSLPSLLDTRTHATAFVNTINHEPFNSNPASEGILAKTLGVDDNPTDTVAEIDSPFVVLERGPGGHAPYGDFDGNAWEYFRERKSAPRSQFADEYARAVRRDADHFERQLRRLEDRGLREDTLIVYTSDHGELLGESGMLGHNGPIHRRLVEVPTVFIHPDLPSTTVHSRVTSHVDTLPTVSEVAGVQLDSHMAPVGRNLTGEDFPTAAPSFHSKTASLSDYLPKLEFSYESVWDAYGGYVFARSNPGVRFAGWAKYVTKSAKREFARQNSPQNFWAFVRGDHQQGAPRMTIDEASEYLETIHSLDTAASNEDLDVPTDRLRELGYLNP